MKKKKAYIAGAIKGLPIASVMKRFEIKAMEMEAKGYLVINPVVDVNLENEERYMKSRLHGTLLIPLNDEDTRNHTIGYCLNLMCQCDEVHLLPGWQESQGATLERDVALRLGITVVYP